MTSGGRELAKWLALVLMTGDHVNKVLFAGALPWLTELARVCLPIFAVVLVYNLANASPGATARAFLRLVLAGLVVQPLHALAFGYWLPLNVLLTLALGIYICSTQSLWGALLAWSVLGFFVDFQWAGPAIMLAACCWFRRPGWVTAGYVLAAFAALCWWNGNAWALLALPILWALGRVDVPIPRVRWLFLAYYVGHLAVLAVLAAWLGV